jgi:hypothetical protein
MENVQWRIENVPLRVRSFCILHSALCIPPAPLRRSAPQNSGDTPPTHPVGAFFCARLCALLRRGARQRRDDTVISGVFEQVVYFFKRFSCSWHPHFTRLGLMMASPRSRWLAWFRAKTSSEIARIFYS